MRMVMPPCAWLLQEHGPRCGSSMTRRSFVGLLSTTLLTWSIGRQTCAAQATVERALLEFGRAVADYLGLQQRLARVLPPLEMSSDAQRIRDTIDARADVIRRARR